MDWQQKSYDVSGAGSHTLKWIYVKNGSVSSGDDCGWVDYVQWTGSPDPTPDPTKWKTIDYTYDPAGRRIKKTIDDDYSLKYVYDGGNVIAEYDHDNFLLRKYIYGARVDEAVCMIDAVDNDAEYYYHFDGLGSVVALSDSDGDAVQTYEYSAYGQVAASDPEFLTNPYMFTGRRFDLETGLYYYRARYYNPHIGRFMQTDPVGYDDGINWYLYCGNNPVSFVDPSGNAKIIIKWIEYVPDSPLEITFMTDEGYWIDTRCFGDVETLSEFLDEEEEFIFSSENTFEVYHITEREGEGGEVDSGSVVSVYFTISETGSFGGTGFAASGIGIDSTGNFFWIESGGIGGGTPTAAISASVGLVNTDASGLEGVGNQSGGSVSGVGGDYVLGGGGNNTYMGGEVQLNLGTPVPEAHTIVTDTNTRVLFNFGEVFDSITEPVIVWFVDNF